MPPPANHFRPPIDFTVEEVEQLGRKLGPHLGRIMEQKLQPVRDDITSLKRRASLWGAVTGALTAIGLGIFNRLTGGSWG